MGEKVVAGERRGYWFPLVLLGFGLLGLLGWRGAGVGEGEGFGWFAYTPVQPGADYLAPSNTAVAVLVDVPDGSGGYPIQDWTWVVAVFVTLVATVAWYARRAGGGSVPAHLAVVVGGAIAVPAGYVAADVAGMAAEPGALITSVALPLIGLGGLAVAWAYFRLTAWRRATVAATGSVCLVVGGAVLLGTWSPAWFLPVTIAGGLLALARFERSRPLAVVACAVLVAMIVFPAGILSMLIPAAIMLAAGIAVLARQAAQAAPA